MRGVLFSRSVRIYGFVLFSWYVCLRFCLVSLIRDILLFDIMVFWFCLVYCLHILFLMSGASFSFISIIAVIISAMVIAPLYFIIVWTGFSGMFIMLLFSALSCACIISVAWIVFQYMNGSWAGLMFIVVTMYIVAWASHPCAVYCCIVLR